MLKRRGSEQGFISLRRGHHLAGLPRGSARNIGDR
jgi:hypothetical protein